MVFHCQRFTDVGEKLAMDGPPPENLELNVSDSFQPVSYELKAIVSHYGQRVTSGKILVRLISSSLVCSAFTQSLKYT